MAKNLCNIEIME